MAFDPKLGVSQWNRLLDNLDEQLKNPEPLGKKLDEINQIINQLASERFDNVSPQAHQQIVDIQREVNALASQQNLSEDQEKDLSSKLGNICNICKIAEVWILPSQAFKRETKPSAAASKVPAAEHDIKELMGKTEAETDNNAEAVLSRLERIQQFNSLLGEVGRSNRYPFIEWGLSKLISEHNFYEDYPETSQLIAECCSYLHTFQFIPQVNDKMREMIDEIIKTYREEIPKKNDDVKLFNYLFDQILHEKHVGSPEVQLKDIRQSLQQLISFPSLQKSFPDVYEKLKEAYEDVDAALKAPDKQGSINSILEKIYDAYELFKNHGPKTGLPTDVLAIILSQAIDSSGAEAMREIDQLGTISGELEKVAQDSRTVAEQLGRPPGIQRFDAALLERAGPHLNRLYLDFWPSPEEWEQLGKICPNIRDLVIARGRLDDSTLTKIAQLFPKLEALNAEWRWVSAKAFEGFLKIVGDKLKSLPSVISSINNEKLSLIVENSPGIEYVDFDDLNQNFNQETISCLAKLTSLVSLNLRHLNEKKLRDLFQNPFPNIKTLILQQNPSKELLALIAKSCPQIKEISIISSGYVPLTDEKWKEIKAIVPNLETFKCNDG